MSPWPLLIVALMLMVNVIDISYLKAENKDLKEKVIQLEKVANWGNESNTTK